jgi:hypothetical protein
MVLKQTSLCHPNVPMFRSVKNGTCSLDRFLSLICEVLADRFSFLRLEVTSQVALRAEILFLRKQLAF